MRREHADEVARARDAVADAATSIFYARHPDWLERYGEERARAHGVEDARHHLDFLETAVELEDPSVFRDYALWCRDVLGARGIGAEYLQESLETIRDELVPRLSPAAAEAVHRALAAGLKVLPYGGGSSPEQADPLTPACRLYVAAAVTGRRDKALAIVREAVRDAGSPVEVYVDLFQSALYEVGRRWQTAGLTVAEEHMASATTQFILSVLHEELPRSDAHRGTAVVTGVVEEQHVVGAAIVANVLAEDGWDVRFIGGNLPHDSIVAAVVEHGAALLAVSVTLSRRVADVEDLIALVRQSVAEVARG